MVKGLGFMCVYVCLSLYDPQQDSEQQPKCGVCKLAIMITVAIFFDREHR